MGFLMFQICFVDYGNQCSMSISSAPEPESSLMTLTGSEGRGRGGALFQGGDYFKYFGQRGAINRGTASYYSKKYGNPPGPGIWKFKIIHF